MFYQLMKVANLDDPEAGPAVNNCMVGVHVVNLFNWTLRTIYIFRC